MGLISFVKSAGEKLFGASEAKAATPDALQKELEKHGLDTSNVKIAVDGDKVHVTGTAPTTEQAEKIAVALGNTVGVQTVQNDIKPAASYPRTNHTVKSGDTLWAISEKEYGKGAGGKYDIIFQANRPMLTHPDKIYPGQVLRIPPLS